MLPAPLTRNVLFDLLVVLLGALVPATRVSTLPQSNSHAEAPVSGYIIIILDKQHDLEL